MQAEDHELAVLFAIDGATKESAMASIHEIFEHLPLVLRNRWATEYLSRGPMRDLIREDYVQVMQVGPGQVNYCLTDEGRREMLAPSTA